MGRYFLVVLFLSIAPVYAVLDTVFITDLESEDTTQWSEWPGYSTHKLMEWGVPSGTGHPGAHSGSKVYGTVLSGNYNANSVNDYLGTPFFKPEGLLTAKFYMWHWYSTEPGPNDGGRVYYNNGTSTIWAVIPVDGYDGTVAAFAQAGFGGSSGGWVCDSFNITPSLTLDSIRMTFRFGTNATVSNYLGWYIDDLSIVGSNPTPQITGLGGAGEAYCSTYTNGSGNVAIKYELYDSSNSSATVSLLYRLNTGSWDAANFKTGDWGVIPASDKNTDHIIVWTAGSQLGEVDTTLYCRVVAVDNNSADTSQTVSFTFDSRLPTQFASFSADDSTQHSITLNWTEVAENHFSRYEAWYGTSESDVGYETGGAQKWDTNNDASLSTRTTIYTTLTGLVAATRYYVKLKAIDSTGNVRNTAVISKFTAPTNSPVLTGWDPYLSARASQAAFDSVRIGYKVSDADNGTVAISAQRQINAGTWASLGTSYGDIGAGIPTSATEQDTIYWTTLGADVDSSYLIRVIAYDGASRDTTTSSYFTIDKRAPLGMANLTFPETTATTVTVSWTAVTTEKHFHHYEIWWGKNQTYVQERTGTASEWDFADDTALRDKSTNSTIITGVNDAATYWFKIWAYDSAGNYQTLSEIVVNKAKSVIQPPHYADYETSAKNGYTFSADADWVWVSGAPHTGTYSVSTNGYVVNTNTSMFSPIYVANGYNNIWFTFWHRYYFEQFYDGGVIEIDTGGKNVWLPLVPVSNYYGQSLVSNAFTTYNNDLGDSRACFTDTLATWTKDSVDLSAYQGCSQFQIRFRIGSDNSGGQALGWIVDDAYLYGTLNSAPTITGLSAATRAGAAQVNNGSGNVTLSYEVSDNEQSTVAVSAYYKVNASGWIQLTDTSGDIGAVSATSSTTDRTITWNAAAQIGSTDYHTFQVRIVASDGILSDTVVSDSFHIDTRAPTGLANLDSANSTTNSASISWTTATEDHFHYYEIWYGTDMTQVNNRSGAALEWDQNDYAPMSSILTSSTTIIGLTPGTKYYIRIWAVDSAGNEMSNGPDSLSTQPTSAPVVTGWDPAIGIGHVQYATDSLNVQYEVWDDDNANVTITAEYRPLGGDWTAMTTLGGSDVGSVARDALADRRVKWDVNTDLPASDTLVDVRIRASDGTNNDTNTISFQVDTKAPAGLAGLDVTDSTNTYLTVQWTPVSTETHFSKYVVYYGDVRAQVLAGTSAYRDPATSSKLATMSTYRDTLSGLTTASLYFVKIWAYDSMGNFIASNFDSGRTNIAPITSLPWSDGAENGNIGWTGNDLGQDTAWSIRSKVVRTGTYAWNVGNGQYKNLLQAWVISPRFNLTSYAGKTIALSFYHEYETEGPIFDGGIVQVDTNGSGTWRDVTPILNGYTATLSSSYSNPLGGKPAWIGTSPYTRSMVNFTPYAGKSDVRFRFNLGTDNVNTRKGWNVDDINVAENTKPDNGIVLSANIISGTSIELSWTTTGVDSTDADSLAIWYKKGDPADSANDPTATLLSRFPLVGTTKDTISNLTNGTYYVSACVRDVLAAWSDTASAATAIVTITAGATDLVLNAVNGIDSVTATGWTAYGGGTANIGRDQSAIEGTYVSSVTANSKLFTAPMADTTMSGAIDSIQVHAVMIASAASKNAYVTIKSGGTIYQSASISPGIAPLDASKFISKTWITNPNGSVPWTWTTINALTAGVGTGSNSTTYTADNTHIHVFYRNTAPQVFDTAASANGPLAVSRTDGSDTVDLWYQVRDAEDANVTITAQFRDRISGTWATLTNAAGALGTVAANDSSVHRQIRWHAAGQAQIGTSFVSDSIQFRLLANDGVFLTTFSMTAANFKLDTRPPEISTAVSYTSGHPAADSSGIRLDGAFNENNPGSNIFWYKLNNGSYTSSAGASNTQDPPATLIARSLNGDDSLTAIRLIHTDDFGHSDTSEDLTVRYVKPKRPDIPVINNITLNSADIAVDSANGEAAGLSYAIRVDSAGNITWLKGDGTRDITPVWNTVTGWGTKTVTGLTSGKKYYFRVKSRHLYNSDLESDLSPADSATPQVNTEPELFDTLAVTTTLQALQRIDGSDTVDIYYQVRDAEQANVTITVQYRNGTGGAWTNLLRTAGAIGTVAASDSSIHRRIRWHIAGQTALETNTLQLRIIAYDGIARDTLMRAAADIAVDSKSPQIISSIAYTTGHPTADSTGIRIDGAFSELNAKTNTFYYKYNGSGYNSVAGTAGAANPDPVFVALSLDGNDSLDAIKLVHIDSIGHTTVSEDLTVRYVKPKTPGTPALSGVTASTIDVTVVGAAGEVAGLSHAIQVDSSGTIWWVQASGARGASPVWNTIAGWGTKTVTGLNSPVNQYLFRTKSGNLNSTTTESELSPAAAAPSTPPELFDTLAVTTTLQAAQRTDGSDTLDMWYQVHDADNANVIINAEYRNGVSGAWTALADTAGNIGSVAAGDSSVHRRIRWYIASQLGTDWNTDSLQLRIIAYDGAACDTLTRATADLIADTKAPVVATAIVYTSGHPSADSTGIRLDGEFTEPNPGSNTFWYKLNGGAYTSAAGDNNTPAPADLLISLALDGNDSLDAIKLVHTDDFGHETTSENTTIRYVKPKQPAHPSLGGAMTSSLDVTINEAAGEGSGLAHDLRVVSAGTTWWGQANGSRGGSPVWQTIAVWGTKTVTGLAENMQYLFRTKSRNQYNAATESDLSPADSASTLTSDITYVTLNASPGTHIANQWTVGGASEGDDQAAVGGTASYTTLANQSLVVNIDDHAVTGAIDSIQVSVLLKSSVNLSGTGDGIKIRIKTHNVAYTDSVIDEVATTYTYYTFSWINNPNTDGAWTWGEFDPLQAGCVAAVSAPSALDTLFADHVMVKVFYQPSGASGDTGLALYAVAGTGNGNAWTAGGATVGDDAMAIDGSASTVSGSGNLLSVPIRDTTAAGTIDSVRVRVYAKNSIANQAIRPALRISAATYVPGANQTVTASYAFYSYAWAQNPATSLAWTWNDINNLEAGCVSYSAGGSFSTDFVSVHVFYQFQNMPPRLYDTLGVGTNMQAVQRTDGSDTVDIWYRIRDNDDSEDTVFAYYRNGVSGSWTALTNTTGNTGIVSASDSTVKQSIRWHAAGQLSTSFESDSVQIRLIARDTGSVRDTLTMAAANLIVDTKAPDVSVATAYSTGSPAADSAGIRFDAAFTEPHPNTNIFYYKLNNGAYDAGTAGTVNAADPAALLVSVGLNGDDSLNAIKIIHTDDFGHVTTSENATVAYVKPLTPDAPVLSNPTTNTLDIAIDSANDEAAGLSYAIYISPAVSGNSWVQAGGSVGAVEAWQTVGGWSTTTVAGLSSPVSQYSFQAKSRNKYSASVESELSVSAVSGRPDLYDTLSNPSGFSASQRGDGSDTVDIWYALADNNADDTILVSYRNGTGAAWTVITHMLGDTGVVPASDPSAHRRVRWHAAGQLGTSFESDSIQLRIVALDDDGFSDTLAMAAANLRIDTKVPASGSIVIADNNGKTADKTPSLTLTSAGGDSMRLAGTEAALSSAAFIAFTPPCPTFEMTKGPACDANNGLKKIWIEFKDQMGHVQASHVYDSTIYDGAAPDNDMTLTATNVFLSDTVFLSWNPVVIDSGDADSVGIWYKATIFPSGPNDPTGVRAGVYYKNITKDTLTGLSPGIYYFILTVRDTLGNWSDTFSTAVVSVLIPYVMDLNAEAGTGAGNQFIPMSGTTAGADAAAINGVADTITGTGKLLSVPLQNNVGGNGPIDSLRLDVYAKNTGVNKTMALTLVVGGAPYEEASAQTITTSYDYYTHFWSKNPATNQAWTWSDIDNLQAGITTKTAGGRYWVDHARIRVLYNPPPDNDMTLTASALSPTSVKLEWNPSAIDSGNADTVGIWYKTTDYPDSGNDVTATLVGKYPTNVIADTLTGLSAGTKYWFALTVRNNKGVYADTTASACDTIRLNAPPVVEGWDEAVNIVAAERTDGSGLVDITYEVDDNTEAKAIITAQYYNGSTWQDIPDGNLSGDKGSIVCSPSTHYTLVWDAKTHLGSTVEASNYNVRIIANDQQSNNNFDTLALAASNLVVDTKAPVVATAIIYTTGNPSADSTGIRLDGAFTETNPGSNTYWYKLNGSAYVSAAGDNNIANPLALLINLALFSI